MLGRMLLSRGMMVLALFVMQPRAAHAEGESDVRAYLRSVNRLYEDLEYERALAQLDRARNLARTVEENVTLSLYEGIILADMSRWDDSAAAFKEALFLRLEAKLPLKVSPKVEQHFEAVREKVRREVESQRPLATPAAPQAPAPTPVPIEAQPTVVTQAPQRGLLRPQVLIPAIGSGVLLVAGGTSWALSRRELSLLRENDESLATREDAHGSASRGRTYQTLGLGLIGAGLVGAGITTALYFRAPAEQASLSVGTDGKSAFVQGKWP